METYSEAFNRRASFRMEYRLRRHDGQYRWLLDIGVPRFNSDGTFVGYIGSCIDVTDHKLAEEALSDIGQRLLEAQENERKWIARELHDDINQKIALLEVRLQRWGQESTGSAEDIRNQIEHTSQGLSNIAKDIHDLSHRLHSSKLEYLGLVTAAGSFCRELSDQRNVKVEFSHADVPRSLSQTISLCLFRVLQEALQNAVKHSGARDFEVNLHGREHEIRLMVTDRGVGFDLQDAMRHRGVGLISMQERLHLVNGKLSIESQAGVGTTILARVPLARTESTTLVA
jgi:signal transduction histidine kinase